MFLELRHLRTLQALFETGSLAAAARKLHLTQSALSHQLRALEHYFEVPMVRKGTRPLVLSPAGQRLLTLACQVLPEVERVERELADSGQSGTARLYLTLECHACYDWLLPLLAPFRESWPAVDIDIRQARFEALPDLLSGKVDLVVTSDRSHYRSLRFVPLFAYEARMVLAESHPLARSKRIQPHQLVAETLITYPVPASRLDVFTRFLDPAGVAPASVRQSELTAVILQLVASRRGVAVLPDWVLSSSLCPPGLVSRPLGRRGLHGRMYAAVRAADAGQPWVSDFVALASR